MSGFAGGLSAYSRSGAPIAMNERGSRQGSADERVSALNQQIEAQLQVQIESIRAKMQGAAPREGAPSSSPLVGGVLDVSV